MTALPTTDFLPVGNTQLKRLGTAGWIGLIAILALASLRFHRSAVSASELMIDPDEVEYVSGAVSLATGHGYRVEMAGRRLPSQYPPAFSAILSLVYRLLPGNIGAGIYVVFAFGLLAVFCVYLIGFLIEGAPTAVLAALAVIAEPTITRSARLIMSDVPSLALGMIVLAVLMRAQARRSGLLMAAAGVAAFATLVRPFNLFLMLPVICTIALTPSLRSRRFILLLTTALMASAPAAFTLIYNKHAFGEYTRDGYKFWAAVPYDYLSMEFSPKYLKDNLGLLRERSIAATAVLGIAAFAWAIRGRFWKNRPQWSPLLCFAMTGLLPMTLAYGLYYFPAGRMHLNSFAACCISAAALTVVFIKKYVPPRLIRYAVMIPAVALAATSIYGTLTTHDPRIRRDAAAFVAQNVPTGSTVISTLDPVYFSLAADPAARFHYVPLSRMSPKMAFLVMTSHRIAHLNPPPTSLAPACQGLINGGAIPLFSSTALDDPELTLAELAKGQKVYLDLSWLDLQDPSDTAFSEKWNTSPVNQSTRLYQVTGLK